MTSDTAPDPFLETFERLAPPAFPDLWTWQGEVLATLGGIEGDVAIELPTGAGKTVAALLVCEEYRKRTSRPVAYLTGTKQLTTQVATEAARLGVPAAAFSGPKATWSDQARTDYEFASVVGVMNYWNYFNESPGVGPAGLLVMDDVHLAEGPLRDFFGVFVSASTDLFTQVLKKIEARFPYYNLVTDLLAGLAPAVPAEMLSPLDSLEIAAEVGALLDIELENGTSAWWAWKRTRSRASSCCWLISPRGLTITPWIPPSQTIQHFNDPERRLYLSATVGDVHDLRRRIGCPPVTKISAQVRPRQGKRLVAMVRADREQTADEIVDQLKPLLHLAKKSLWLCARSSTAVEIHDALTISAGGAVRRLEGDNGAADDFSAAEEGALVCAGRFDGMDFPDDTCRLEILPEIPVATSELEEFVSAYLRDAAFARGRFAQRVAQALGRCNRGENDRAVYILWDSAFFTALGNRRGLALLPSEIRSDVYGAVRRSGDPDEIIEQATQFLSGSEPVETVDPPPEITLPSAPADDELAGVTCMWSEDYQGAAHSFGRAAEASDGAGEVCGFWLAMRAMALTLAARRFNDTSANRHAAAAIAQAISSGGSNTFFSRLRASQARAAQAQVDEDLSRNDRLFAAWDALLDRRQGEQLAGYRAALLKDFDSPSHDSVARAVAELGQLLGLQADTPQAKQGEPDVLWDISDPRRRIAFEVKLAPKAKTTTIADVNQAEGAVRALISDANVDVRGVLLTPHDKIESKAVARLEHVRLLRLKDLRDFASQLLDLLSVYAEGFGNDAQMRERSRRAVEPRLPDRDLIWRRRSPAKTVWVKLSR